MQKLIGSQWAPYLAGKEKEFAKAKDKLEIFERVAPRLIAEARNIMRGKQAQISEATAELAGKIDPAIQQKALEIRSGFLILQSKELADLFKNHGFYLDIVPRGGDVFYAYGQLQCAKKVEGIDFVWLDAVKTNAPASTSLAIVRGAPGKRAVAEILFYPEITEPGNALPETPGQIQDFVLKKDLETLSRMLGNVAKAHAGLVVDFFSALLDGRTEFNQQEKDGQCIADTLCDNKSYGLVALVAGMHAYRKYSALPGGEEALLEAMRKDSLGNLACHEIHHTLEKIIVYEGELSKNENVMKYVQKDSLNKEIAAILAELAFGPNPYITLYNIFNLKAIAQTAEHVVPRSPLDSIRATQAVFELLDRSPQMDDINAGSEKALREMALGYLDGGYRELFGASSYRSIFKTEEVFQKLGQEMGWLQ